LSLADLSFELHQVMKLYFSHSNR